MQLGYWCIAWCIWSAQAVTTKAEVEAAVRTAEELYLNHAFTETSQLIHQLQDSIVARSIPKAIGTLHRLAGHLCLFGQHKDSEVNLSCAWKAYINGAKEGDAESYFFVGFMLESFLFDSLAPLGTLFHRNISSLIQEQTLKVILESVHVWAKTCYYFSAIGGSYYGLLKLGYGSSCPNRGCTAAAQFYAQAADKLLSYFEKDCQLKDLHSDYILSMVDPFAVEQDPMRSLASLRLYEALSEQLDDFENRLSLLGNIARKCRSPALFVVLSVTFRVVSCMLYCAASILHFFAP